MLFDANGKYTPLGSCLSSWEFNPHFESALPTFLQTDGVSPVVAYNAPSGSERGTISLTTKSSTPAIDDAAGLSTKSIASNQYAEILAVFESILPGSGASQSNCELVLQAGNGSTTGFVFKSNTDGTTSFQLPPAAAVSSDWQWMNTVNVDHKKNIGVVIRPLSGEVFITAGDPRRGAGVVAYGRGFVDFVGGITLKIVTKTAAQRSMTLSSAKLALSLI